MTVPFDNVFLNEGSTLNPLFLALRGIPADPTDKPDPAENLTDTLEIVAVQAGIKPAHLSGQGMRSERILVSLEEIANQHGLLTLRTNAIRRYRERMPAYEAKISEWQRDQDELKRKTIPYILWIYKDPSLGPLIQHTVEGRSDVSKVLGYPQCCVSHDNEEGTQLSELLIDRLRTIYSAKNAADIIELLKADAKVSMDDFGTLEHMSLSHTRFPYIQFEACPTCLSSTISPAAVINSQMRDLAHGLSESFGREIWRTAFQCFSPEKLKKLGRNDPCPCGRGRKFKKCCH